MGGGGVSGRHAFRISGGIYGGGEYEVEIG